MEKYALPTGYLFTDDYSKGQLETLSIGDYGKHHNIKADFLGYTREINGVVNTACMPLSEKWVITLSTQYGCVQRCNFCDVPNVKFRGNASFDDLLKQVISAINLFEGVTYTERLNIHFARMGEPIFNDAVFEFAEWLYNNKRAIKSETGLSIETLHPVMTTSLPNRLKGLQQRLFNWCSIKNGLYNGQAGLQFSINSTDQNQRDVMFGGSSLTLSEFANMACLLPEPIGRKYCLNFAYSTDYTIDGKVLASMFDPDKFMCKITPIHNNNACSENGIQTIGGYDSFLPYRKPEESLKENGFDVLVFIPSIDEENGLVTCGNAVLGGGQLKTENNIINIKGIKS